LMEVFTIAGGIVMLAFIDRKGRKMLQTLGFVGIGAFLLLFDSISNIGIVAVIPIAGMIVYGMGMQFFNQAGPGSITASGMYGVELAPTKVRSQIQSYTVAAGRTGAALSSFVFPILFIVLGESFAFLYLAGLSIAAALVTFIFIPETKGSLEQAADELEEMKDIAVADVQ
jgi:Sugar (and other) transporter.